MSDTPLSDSTAHNVAELDMLCRKLERELNALDASALRLGTASRQLLEMACEQKERIKQLEEQLIDTKNKHAVLVADVVLNEDRAERIKRLEEAGDYLCAAAAFMGWHDKIETWNKAKEAK